MRTVTDRMRLVTLKAGRWAAGPLAVRVLLFIAGCMTLGLAMPQKILLGRFTAFFVLGAALVAIAPRGRMPSALIFVATGAWMASTTAFHEDVVVWKLLSLAAGMYLTHTISALAAVLPYDAVLPPGVVGAWFLRAGIILAVSTGLGVFAMIEAPILVGPVYLMASIGGVIIVGLLAWLLTLGVRR